VELAAQVEAAIFDIQRFSVHDGPGIRTLVFFKGCPLRCAWCSNPESQAAEPELVFFASKCARCLDCLSVCRHGACQSDEDGESRFDRSLCVQCGACAETCYAGARMVLGRSMSVDDVLCEVRKDAVFYRHSDGGVTLGGGEPAIWSRFAARLLQALQAEGMHTAIETCGHVDYGEIERLLPHLDLVMYDVKHMDPEQHERYTGATNETVLANLDQLATEDVEIVVRVPIIPGVNDDADNVGRTAEWAAIRGIAKIDLLPYHGYAQDKYGRLGQEYGLTGLQPPSGEQMAELAAVVRSRGLTCQIGG
jgi:pyruvate formate lyase activating enzyme